MAISIGTTGVSFGIYSFNRSSAGVGAYGHASSPTGATTGVWGESVSSLGRGIYGYAAALTGSGRSPRPTLPARRIGEIVPDWYGLGRAVDATFAARVRSRCPGCRAQGG